MADKKNDLMERLSGLRSTEEQLTLIQFRIPTSQAIKIRDALKKEGLLPRDLYMEAAAILLENISSSSRGESKAKTILRRNGRRDNERNT